MVTEITLGNFGQQNGKNVLTGGASKIDTKALVEAQATAKRQPAVRLETANKRIDKQTEAFTKLKTLFSKFQTAADTLRNPPGVANASKNIFEYRTASLSSSVGATASNYVDVSVQPGAVAQSYSINSITQIAYETKQQTGNILLADSTTASAVTASGSPTAGLFSAGTVNLRAVDGTVGGVALTLNAGDSLQTVAAKFNEISSRTGIQATIINASTGVYNMIFTATKTGTTYGFDLGLISPAAGAGVVSDASGVLSHMTYTTRQAAQNAMFTVDSIPVQRESNSVADLVDNMTFTLKQPSAAAGVITVAVKPDTTLISNAITQFADAYNEFRLFVSQQQELDTDSKPKDTAVLYNNGTFRTMVDSISNELTRTVQGITSGDPSVFGDIGMSIDNFAGDATNLATKNIFVVDADKVTSALLSNFEGVRNLFEYQQSSNNTNFATFKRSNNLNVTGFTMVIDQTTGSYTATYTDATTGLSASATLDGVANSAGGVTLTGRAGTVFEGSQFIYAATGNATVAVKVTQGYADRFYNLLDGFINTKDGTLTQELTTLDDTKTRNTTEVTAIDDRITKYREKLVQQYANLESALTKANQLLSLLDAQANARNNG